MKYLNTKFTINTSDDALKQIARELLSAAAGECGYESFVDTEEGLDAYIQRDFFDEAAMKEALAQVELEGVDIQMTTTEVEDRNWNETWENEVGFQPITIGDRMVVFDALHADTTKIGNYDIEVGICARNAFGTGTHETTRMVLASLLDTDLEGKSVLDCGCGTGILGITALKCGAERVVGYDIDEWSVNNTRQNAILNGVGDGMEVYEGDGNVLSHVSGVFDVVVANINRNILLNDMPLFKEVMNAKATLIISGFYADDCNLLITKAIELGLTLTDRKSDGDWQCLTFKS